MYSSDPGERLFVVFAQHGITGASMKPNEDICTFAQKGLLAEFGDLHIFSPSSPLIKPNSHLLFKPKVLSLELSLQIHLSSIERRNKPKSFWFAFFSTLLWNNKQIFHHGKHFIGPLQSRHKISFIPIFSASWDLDLFAPNL